MIRRTILLISSTREIDTMWELLFAEEKKVIDEYIQEINTS